jgi:hypothetical protein
VLVLHQRNRGKAPEALSLASQSRNRVICSLQLNEPAPITYATAAALSVRHGHRNLSACYAFSALLHIGIATVHFLNLG